MIREGINLGAPGAILRETGRVQVADILDERLALALRECLEQHTPWSLAVHRDGHSKNMDASEYRALSVEQKQAEYARAGRELVTGQFGFAYDSYPMIRKYMEKADSGLLLHRIVEAMNAPPWLEMARELTGDSRIRRSDCQATCYRPGQFLTHHDDDDPETGRLFAYVLGLTRLWRADWGGLLQFLDDKLRVTETFHPEFNSLSVFAVPQRHCVSMVAPFAQVPRLSITGWFLR